MLWRKGNSFFTCYLFDLLAKADNQNFHKISNVYPDECEIFMEWKNSNNEEEFFNKYELDIHSANYNASV